MTRYTFSSFKSIYDGQIVKWFWLSITKIIAFLYNNITSPPRSLRNVCSDAYPYTLYICSMKNCAVNCAIGCSWWARRSYSVISDNSSPLNLKSITRRLYSCIVLSNFVSSMPTFRLSWHTTSWNYKFINKMYN